MKYLASLLLILFVAAGCGDKSRQLVVLHTNDHHGMIFAETKDGHDVPLKDGPIGGISERATLIKEARKSGEILLLDAGDMNTSIQPFSNYFKGDLDVRLYSLLAYDAVTLGNNEFQTGINDLKRQIEIAEFPFLGANVKYLNGDYVGSPWLIKTVNGIKVGVFGILTRSTAEISPEDGVVILDEIATAKEAVSYLKKEGCEVIIALTHMGFEDAYAHTTSFELAEAVRGIDLIIDGHSHSYISELSDKNIVAGIPVVSAGSWGRYLGRAQLTMKKGKVTDFAWNVQTVRGVTADTATEDFLASYITEAEEYFNSVIASSTEEFPFEYSLPRKEETAIGNLLNDASVWYAEMVLEKDADFAFMNGGTIRWGLPSGEIRIKNTYEVVPFDNNIVIVEITGDKLISFFERVASFSYGNGGFGQVSKEVVYTVDYSESEKKGVLKNLSIGGKAVEPEKIYSFVTSDFISKGGNGHTLASDALMITDTGINYRNGIIAYLKEMKTVSPLLDGRLTVIK